MGTVHLPDAHAYHMRSRVLSSAGAMAVMIVLAVVMLLFKCLILMMIRTMTNKGITTLDYVNIFRIICVIAISANQQC